MKGFADFLLKWAFWTGAATVLVGGMFWFLAGVNGLSADPQPVGVTLAGFGHFMAWMAALGFALMAGADGNQQ